MRIVFFIITVSLLFLACKTPKEDREDVKQIQNIVDESHTMTESRKKETCVSWTVKYFTDSFGDKTNKKYITNTFFEEGFVISTDPIATIFSKSKVVRRELKVYFIITDENLLINAFTYNGADPVLVEKGKYTIKIKDCNDQIHVFSGYGDQGSLVIDNLHKKSGDVGGRQDIQRLIELNDSLKFQIENQDYSYPAQYQFSMKKTKELRETYNSVF